MKHLDIPEKDLHLLRTCNSAEHWSWKHHFYQFKSELLQAKGQPDGYDLQIINKECWSCEGTGKFSNYGYASDWEPCYKCGATGVYETAQIVLRRWLLNGEVFHEPVGRLYLSKYEVQGEIVYFKNKIQGRIKHEPVPDANPTYAYLHLLHKYNREVFFDMVKRIGESQKTRAKWKWQQAFRKRRNMLEGLRRFFGVKAPQPEPEDLPF